MNFSVRLATRDRVKRLFTRAIVCGVPLVLPSCQIPKVLPPGPGPVLPADFKGAASQESSAQLGIDEFFDDPVLTRTIALALAGNQELKIIEQDIQIASNEILSRRGAYLPFIGFRANAGVEKPGDFTPIGTVEKRLEYFPGKHYPEPRPNYLLTTNIFWQLDIWRELRNARDAAYQRYLAAIERRNDFVTRLVAEVAQNYYELIALDKRLEILTQTIRIQESSLKVAEANKLAGRATELGVQRFLAEVRRNQSEKLIIAQRVIETENRINFLAGRYPQPVERNLGDFIDLKLRTLNVGLPAQLLQNRPDIRQAERDLAAAGLDVKIARAHFFPRLDLMAGVGYEAFRVKYLFMTPESLIYNAAGELTAPLINKKAIQADYLTANARQLESVINYQRVVLNAFTEVVNRLSRVENYRKSIDLKKQQLEALATSVQVASNLFQAARADYVDVLFSQRDLRDASIVLIETKQQQLAAIVTTYQALGGGYLWSGPAPEGVPPEALAMPQPVAPSSQPAGGQPPAAPVPNKDAAPPPTDGQPLPVPRPATTTP